MKIFKDWRPSKPVEVERLGKEIGKLTKNKSKYTKLEYMEKQLILFKQIVKYKTPDDVTKQIRKGIKVAKVGIAIYKETSKATGKAVEKIQKVKKKFKILK